MKSFEDEVAEARSRDTLHLSYLERFAAFCREQGWVGEKPKGEFEVLRMRKPGVAEPLIVHAKARAKEHVTTWGQSARMLTEYLKVPKEERRASR